MLSAAPPVIPARLRPYDRPRPQVYRTRFAGTRLSRSHRIGGIAISDDATSGDLRQNSLPGRRSAVIRRTLAGMSVHVDYQLNGCHARTQ